MNEGLKIEFDKLLESIDYNSFYSHTEEEFAQFMKLAPWYEGCTTWIMQRPRSHQEFILHMSVPDYFKKKVYQEWVRNGGTYWNTKLKMIASALEKVLSKNDLGYDVKEILNTYYISEFPTFEFIATIAKKGDGLLILLSSGLMDLIFHICKIFDHNVIEKLNLKERFEYVGLWIDRWHELSRIHPNNIIPTELDRENLMWRVSQIEPCGISDYLAHRVIEYVVCHEFAHLLLGHVKANDNIKYRNQNFVFGKEEGGTYFYNPSIQEELNADLLGLSLYTNLHNAHEIILAKEELDLISPEPGASHFLLAPIIFFGLEEIIIKKIFKNQVFNSTHPDPDTRMRMFMEYIDKHFQNMGKDQENMLKTYIPYFFQFIYEKSFDGFSS